MAPSLPVGGVKIALAYDSGIGQGYIGLLAAAEDNHVILTP